MLDKVVTLATTAQVAEFYGTPLSNVTALVAVHRDEFVATGYRVISDAELQQLNRELEDPVLFKGARAIPTWDRREVLLLELLRGYEVAKGVRAYLLEAESKVHDACRRERRRGVTGTHMLLFVKTTIPFVCLSAAVVLCAPAAHADDADPRIPNGPVQWCQGGMGNVALAPFCNGTPYADGSYWHQTADVPFFRLNWHEPLCVTAGDVPAPPGGCTI